MTMQHTMLYTDQFSFSKDTERRVRHMAMYNVIIRTNFFEHLMYLMHETSKIIASIIHRVNRTSPYF
ncbi:hypothetical protein EK13BL_06005 [Bifidobacterium longum subsp. longum EK13]|nr:hypothetical protein EK13BL_06005 [Bifidobacterium longum subsp. longum EK13]